MANDWTPANLSILKQAVAATPSDALPVLSTARLDRAASGADRAAIDQEAEDLALRLARMHLLGHAGEAERAGWRIVDTDRAIDIPSRLRAALAADALDRFFAGLRPQHPQYAASRAAYAVEQDSERRATIARNMERWRWMPQSLGDRHLLVNAAAFELSLWDHGKRAATWPVIVGKPATPTPVFNATVTGVMFNPWWNIPASIVREKRGRFPASQGYVRSGGGWRQRPGPANSLGQIRLVMPNPFSVYLHDTPGKALFQRETRAFSHGCVRVGDALGLAATLLGGVRTRSEIDAIVATRKTTTVDLPASLPVYVAYFTASTDPAGALVIKPDLYGRDARVPPPADKPDGGCGA